MLTVLVAPLFLLALAIFDGPVSRLIGAKVAATILFSTGVVVAGFGWHAAMAGGCDIAVLFGGAALARRFGLSPRIYRIWMRRITLAFSVFLALAFAALALIATLLTGLSADSISFDIGFLMSGGSLALLLRRNREQVSTRSGAGSLVSGIPASRIDLRLRQTVCVMKIGPLDAGDGEPCAA